MLDKTKVTDTVIETEMIRSRGGSLHENGLDSQINAFFRSINFLGLVHENDAVLEMGCGEGNTLKKLAKTKKINGVGIDLYPNRKAQDPEIREFFGQLKGYPPIRYITGDFEDMTKKFDDNTFDAVYSYAAITYAYDKLKAIAEAYRVLKVGKTALLHLQGEPHEGFVPPIEDIVSNYQNNGQIMIIRYMAHGEIKNLGDNPTTGHTALVIEKKSEQPLILPTLTKTVHGPKHIPASTTCIYEL